MIRIALCMLSIFIIAVAHCNNKSAENSGRTSKKDIQPVTSEVTLIFKKLIAPHINKTGIKTYSSYIQEKGKPLDTYSPIKIEDLKKDTSWAFRNGKHGIGEFVFVRHYGNGQSYEETPNKSVVLKFKIINGYAKSRSLYQANNRVKRLRLDFYEAEEGDKMGTPYLFTGPIFNTTIYLHIKDTPNLQEYKIKLDLKHKPKYDLSSFVFMAKITVEAVYRGNKHDDTCISELSLELADS